MIGTSSEKINMNTTADEVQAIGDSLAIALQNESPLAEFALDYLKMEHEIVVRGDLKVLIVADREYPLTTPLHAASAALAVHEGFIVARTILVREARDTALMLAAGERAEAHGKVQRALATIAALPFVSQQTRYAQPQR